MAIKSFCWLVLFWPTLFAHELEFRDETSVSVIVEVYFQAFFVLSLFFLTSLLCLSV